MVTYRSLDDPTKGNFISDMPPLHGRQLTEVSSLELPRQLQATHWLESLLFPAIAYCV